MKNHRTLGACAAVAALSFVPASFAAVTHELDRVINGGAASTPFATFNNASGGVELVVGGLQLGTPEFLRTAWFNFTGNPSNLTFTHLSGQAASNVTAGNNAFTVGSAGVFDLQLDYPTAADSRFEAGETSRYLISGAGLRDSMFNVMDQTGSFVAVANIGDGSSFVGAVPEAETYAMLLAGLGLLGFMVNRRKRRVFPTL
jgi:hypothetical protein